MTSTLTVDVLVSAQDRAAAMEEDVRAGLATEPRSIPPVWFYDEVGSRLFDEITRLPEYYLTRAEKAILEERAAEIVARSGADTLVEIGSGTSEKTRLLLDAMSGSGQLKAIVLLDISEEILREAAAGLADRYGVEVRAVVGDMRADLDRLPLGGRSLWAFLGSTIGNFEPAGRAVLLEQFRAAMAAGDSLLLGTDLVKGVDRLVAAYDDAQGVTAAFDLNVLCVLNAALSGDFEPAGYEHLAVWNGGQECIEMRLRSRVAQRVHLERVGLTLDIAPGEEILTEISSKFRRETVTAELAASGLVVDRMWTDRPGDFMLTLARCPG